MTIETVSHVGPVAAVIAVVLYRNKVLLVRRINAPDAGKWGFPGGKIEFGETIEAAAERELREETGVDAVASDVITALDALDDVDGISQQHFVLVAVRCHFRSGVPVAGDDAMEARWFDIGAVDAMTLDLSAGVTHVLHRAATLVSAGDASPSA
ncbi:NUDIX hydrolase [Chitinasiproducens palmae]|uniref:Mutator mutT protein n=1 Tax=Chitinasiproducens palmae TaxID=1770053 RepID=A0A1H2PJI3_9BURK|nr:NUDIX hydrolase [Chitinasiproducens palmae]SDV46067.1 mutator mutT protein [Chitinasiproducens palmae]